ncbi:hypothetical protein JCM8202_001319 [Rhodotorula sphaerocarpa]
MLPARLQLPVLRRAAGRPLARLRRPTSLSTASSRFTSSSSPAAPARRSSRLEPYLSALRARYPHADPRSLVVAFIVLHELTALVPLALLFGAFHYLGAGAALVAWVVEETATEGDAEEQRAGAGEGWKATARTWLEEAEAKAERVGRRYGLFGWEKESKAQHEERRRIGAQEGTERAREGGAVSKERLLVSGDVANAAAAYLVTKALLPLRILISLRLSPLLANRIISRFRSWRTGRVRPAATPPRKTPQDGARGPL